MVAAATAVAKTASPAKQPKSPNWKWEEDTAQWTHQWKTAKTVIEAIVFEIASGEWTASLDLNPLTECSLTITLNYRMPRDEAMAECEKLAMALLPLAT